MVQDKGFHLDLEDYLAGVLIMASELVSLLFVFVFFLVDCNKGNKKKINFSFNLIVFSSSPGWR